MIIEVGYLYLVRIGVLHVSVDSLAISYDLIER